MNRVPLRRNAVLYRHLIGARLRSQWQYRVSLFVDTVGAFVLTSIDFVVIMALFGHLTTLGGWSFREVAFLYGTAGLGFALCDLVIGHIENVGDMIRLGQFDTYLLRPAGTLLQVIAADFALRRLGKVIQSLAVLVYAISVLDVHWNVARAALLVLTVLSGSAIFIAIFIITASVQFVIIGSSEIANAFTYGGNQFTSYPISIYRGWLRRLFAYAIPLGFVAYFPSQYILGRTDDPTWVQLVGPLVAFAIAGFAVLVWTAAVRRYRSTGS
jgi:ABC-2 type transport system permease protein